MLNKDACRKTWWAVPLYNAPSRPYRLASRFRPSRQKTRTRQLRQLRLRAWTTRRKRRFRQSRSICIDRGMNVRLVSVPSTSGWSPRFFFLLVSFHEQLELGRERRRICSRGRVAGSGPPSSSGLAHEQKQRSCRASSGHCAQGSCACQQLRQVQRGPGHGRQHHWLARAQAASGTSAGQAASPVARPGACACQARQRHAAQARQEVAGRAAASSPAPSSRSRDARILAVGSRRARECCVCQSARSYASNRGARGSHWQRRARCAALRIGRGMERSHEPQLWVAPERGCRDNGPRSRLHHNGQ